MSVMPAAENQADTSADKAADPLMKNRIRPPIRSLSLENTSLSPRLCWNFSTADGSDPACRCCEIFDPTPNAQSKIFSFTPPSSRMPVMTLDRTFSKIRGAPAMNVGLIVPKLSTIRSRLPSTAVAKPIRNWIASNALPNECDNGSHRYWTSSELRMPMVSTATPSYTQLSLTRSTPFGLPVVPEVYSNVASVSGPTPASASSTAVG